MQNLLDSRQIAGQFNLDRIIETFKNPQVHPKEALLLVGIGFILALVLLTLVALVFIKTPKEAKTQLKRKATWQSKLVFVLFSLELFFVALVITGLSLSIYTDQPVYCRSCHEMEDAYFSWQISKHSRLSCLRCHQVPGISGYIIQKADLLQMIITARSKTYKKPILAHIDNKSCLQCHEKETSLTVASLGIRVKHSDFVDEGHQCTQCHNTVGHAGRVANPKYPSMDTCAICHNNQKASARCGLCHVSDIGQNRRAERRDFPRASLAPTPCNRCHSAEPCNKCHGVEMPHPSDWIERATHAKESAFEKKEVCKKCHDMDFCNDCHNFPGHGPNFKEEHGKITTRDKQQGCIGCHHKIKNNQDYCGLCHP